MKGKQELCTKWGHFVFSEKHMKITNSNTIHISHSKLGWLFHFGMNLKKKLLNK